MLEFLRKVNVYYYTSSVLIVAAIAALFSVDFNSSFIIQLLVLPTVTSLTDTVIKSIRFKKFKYSPSGGITGLILAMVSGVLPIYAQIIVGLVAILQKHLIKFHNRHIFNPAAFGLLFAWIIFNNHPAWWAVGTPFVLLFLFSDYLIRRLPLSLTFYLVYIAATTIGSYLTTGTFSLNLINYPLIFFATVMVVEPRTSAMTTKGMIIEGISLGILLAIMQRFLSIDLFVPTLLLMNLIVYFRILK